MAPSDRDGDHTLSGTHLSTRLLHSDNEFAKMDPAVAPNISVTTTYSPSNALDFKAGNEPQPGGDDPHVYSRFTQPNVSRVEKVLGDLCNGYALTYRSGLAAGYAALVHYNPKRVAITLGYHGLHAAVALYRRGAPIDVVGIDDPLQSGDLLWVETPLNPSGEARNIKHYADRAHAAGAVMVVDATFAPPPLQDPFLWGADCVMHSASKYLGGHSDVLGGVLVVKSAKEWTELSDDRGVLGNTQGSLETFLLLRSLRTHELRVRRQSATATALALWLNKLTTVPAGQQWDGVPGGIVTQVMHSSVQTEPFVREQLSGGHSPCFGILLAQVEWARVLPHQVNFFTSATSLGSVESLIEQRVISDSSADPHIIRISVGLEDLEVRRFTRCTSPLCCYLTWSNLTDINAGLYF
ncbi:hypothetical protein BS47DRAFT_1370885 [Hydnum rufescens UP504]|uniref:Cystathionine gamma-synthase n=1 Tax=Hydnum rufescens UP504 TaxID=1448309 RepID=A0A9P6E1T2_9AGAM|nr:hypothetical protein BS47DRAFT_1370885 [Hydnum rufescens UP504]